ncbi:MAG TPA: tol-pal system protein YbgF [Gammaproteobacteria bacterium]|nr:tol-pal system protein YbgF [Xanthomonadales bacterium]MCB1594465.1 tol-pal system protein YbgF [Xanthomonadales bacterium]HOP23273.1 tol-pal system protein YbgF [Gammaproteobacteria bacterium]HPI95703.1 tol-pal system protein YbgF [Gammaproteobacteria bacterium]HPQ86894.1 tol-pal system protein YbgF [Gammaproteobacteria bacterium]
MQNRIFILILLSLLSLNVFAQKDLSIQQRLAKLEKIVEQTSQERSNVADLVIQNQKLQQQIAELKGVIEEQNFKINNLQEKQKLLYMDVDSRLTELEGGARTPTKPNTSTQNSNNASQDVDISNMTVEVDENYGNSQATTTQVESEPQVSSFQDDYDVAFTHLRAGRFTESARAFEDFIQNHPDSELTDNAYYWLGESYYVKRQYPQALAAFKTLTEKFPQSRKAPDSWLKIGYSYYEMDDLIQAEENLQKVISSYPQSSIAVLAKNRLRQIQRDH